MELEIVAIVLSIFSTIVAFVDIYLNQFRRGRVVVPPLRAYRLEPLNFHVDNESYRGLRMTTALTFVNTGAVSRIVDHLRVRVKVPGAPRDLLLEWQNECEALEQSSHESKFATQPTLGPYDGLSKIYSFVSPFEVEDGKIVSTLEAFGESNPSQGVTAALEMLSEHRWVPLRTFTLRHDGRNIIETDFDRINR